jgi:hypothetical protein
VEQLASDEPSERDPEAWERLLTKKGIENVDFGDRVYIPAEGVANAPVAPTEMKRPQSGVIRVGATDDRLQSGAPSRPNDLSVASESEELPDSLMSPENLRSIFSRFEAESAADTEIREMLPTVVDLLKRLFDSADRETRIEYSELVESLEAATRTAAGEGQDSPEEPKDYLRLIRTERDAASKQSLLGPAEEKFNAFLQAKDFKSARTVLRFIRQCQVFDDGDGELASEGGQTLESITSGGTVQLLLADLLAMPEKPDPDALDLLREVGVDAGPSLVAFLQETDDLRARRVVARLLKEIGGETHDRALGSITYGDNPLVARRVIGVLDCLSANLIADLSRAVTVRNPGVLGEVIKVVQRQPKTIQAQVLGSLLDSASPELVCRGVYYLSEWHLEEAKAKLLALLGESESLEILAAIAAALARWHLEDAVPILADLLSRKQVIRLVPAFPRGLRREFARALAAIGTAEARSVLAGFTKDVDPEVRNIARGMPAPTGA